MHSHLIVQAWMADHPGRVIRHVAVYEEGETERLGYRAREATEVYWVGGLDDSCLEGRSTLCSFSVTSNGDASYRIWWRRATQGRGGLCGGGTSRLVSGPVGRLADTRAVDGVLTP